jgi:hypothetical protein
VEPQIALTNTHHRRWARLAKQSASICVISEIRGHGQVAEWSKARAWRASKANLGRVVEGARLESEQSEPDIGT